MKWNDMHLHRYKQVSVRKKLIQNGVVRRIVIRNVVIRKYLGVAKRVPVVNLFE